MVLFHSIGDFTRTLHELPLAAVGNERRLFDARHGNILQKNSKRLEELPKLLAYIAETCQRVSVTTSDFKMRPIGNDAMKNCALLSFVLAFAASIAGCNQRKETTVTDANIDKVANQEPRQEKRSEHGDHNHAFADPAERAKKWNDPERDKWQHPEKIVAALALTPGATVADIGAGTGYMVAHLSKTVDKGGTVIAIDASAEMVEYLAKRSDDLGPAMIVPRKVSPYDPELQTASVDGVVTLDTWHHVKGREAYAKKVYEGLKRGGRFVVVEYEVDAEIGPPKAMRLEPGQVTKQLEAAGFRVEVVRELMPRHYMVIGHKD